MQFLMPLVATAAIFTGVFLTMPSTTFHGAKAWHSAIVNWADMEHKVLPLDSEEFDTDGFHSTVSNTSRMTVPEGMAGYYYCHASAYVRGDPVQDAPLYVLKNYPGSGGVGEYVVRGSQMTPFTAQPNDVGGIALTSCLVHLDVGDYVEAMLFVDNDNGGGTFPVGGGPDDPHGEHMTFAVAWLGS